MHGHSIAKDLAKGALTFIIDFVISFIHYVIFKFIILYKITYFQSNLSLAIAYVNFEYRNTWHIL